MEVILAILAIIGGAIGMFKDKTTETKHKRPYQVPKPTATPSGGNYQSRREAPAMQPKQVKNTASMEKQREDQMKQLADIMNTNTEQKADKQLHDAIIGNTIRKPGELSNRKSSLKKQVKKNLSNKGLIDGIIMAEVLGPPRAHKPYQSIISERRRKN
ncbi:hypothetical protein ACW2QC_08830 [Virgibacillus sp. FSP13]